MKKFWRQFGEWVTGLNPKKRLGAAIAPQFQIAIFYFISSVIIFIAAGIIADVRIAWFIKAELKNRIADPRVINDAVSQITHDMSPTLWAVRLVSIVAIALIAYIISSIVLRSVRQALESQRQFVANASHELRTPLTIMKTSFDVALIDKDRLTRKEAIALIQSSIQDIDRMANTLEVLLGLSGYESRNKMKGLLFSRVNLYDIAEKIINRFRSIADTKKIALFVSGHKKAAVKGNAAALSEMVANLVSNAIEYTDSGGSVGVFVEVEANGEPVLTVKDSGIGINQNDLPHIFDPFYRGRNIELHNNNTNSLGAGLGLSIVKEVAALHGAKIDVKSNLGTGTIFSVRFPRA